jgi:RNA polymerase-binding transcription factor DksA
MDVGDEAQARTEHFNRLAMQNRAFDLPPVAAKNTAEDGTPLCIECDAEIHKRREVLPSAQRCVDCQSDYEKRSF